MNFAIKNRITEKIFNRQYHDSSMDAYTRLKQKKETDHLKRKQKFEIHKKSFQSEVESITKIYNVILIEQKKMSFCLIQEYSCICIQNIFRSYKARCLLKYLKLLAKARTACFRWRFFVYYRKRKRSTNILISLYRKYAKRKKYFKTIMHHIRIIKIQRFLLKLLSRFRAKKVRFHRKMTLMIVKHIFLFGQTKATCELVRMKTGLASDKIKEYLYKLWKCHCERKRRILLADKQQAKLVFYLLCKQMPADEDDEIQEVSSTNTIISFLRNKFERKRRSLYFANPLKARRLSALSLPADPTPPRSDVLNPIPNPVGRPQRHFQSLLPFRDSDGQQNPPTPTLVSLAMPSYFWKLPTQFTSFYDVALAVLDLLRAATDEALLDDRVPELMLSSAPAPRKRSSPHKARAKAKRQDLLAALQKARNARAVHPKPQQEQEQEQHPQRSQNANRHQKIRR